MSSRWKKIWMDFWGHKSRTMLTILTIMVGTVGIGFISNLQLYMLASMDGDFLSSNPAETRVFAYPMDDDSVKIVREVPGVSEVEGFSTLNGTVLRPDGEKYSIQFTSAGNLYDLKVNTLKPVMGESSIPPVGYKEVLIDSGASLLGYKPGDLITVELGNGKQRELRLAGYLHDATGVPFSQGRVVNAYITPKTMEWIGGSSNYGLLAISVAENPTDEKHVTDVTRAVKERLEHSGLTDVSFFIYQPGHHYAYKLTQGVFLVMAILGWLTVLLSGFLIINTITALMSQQTRQIGIMKATGATTWQIFGMYLVLTLSFGMIALMIAIPVANGAAQNIGGGMAEYLGFYAEPYRGYPATLIQQIIVALVIPFLAALLPMYNSVRLTVREVLTDYGIGGSEKPRKSTVSRNSLLLPRPIRLSLRNAFRRKLRLSLTLFTLVLGGAIFISVMNLWGAFYKVIDELKGYYLSDIEIGFAHSYHFDKVAAMAKTVPGVEDVEGWLRYTGTLLTDQGETETQVSFELPPSTSKLIQPILISGRWLKPGDENALVASNYLINKFPNLKVGDWLTIKTNDRESQWQIVGVVSITATGGDPVIYANYEYFSRLVNQPGEVYSLRVVTTNHDIVTQRRIRDELQAMYTANGIRLGGVMLGGEETQRIAEMFDIFVYFFLAMAILVAIIGGVGLMSTMSINVLERTREIGVMRAIGASSWSIQSIVIVEGMVIGLISWITSIILSIPITGVMIVGVGQQMFDKPMTLVYGVNGIVGWLIGILIIGTISCALPARNASHLTIKDTLAYEG
jgi:putative ABC transport system permease protein